MRILVVRNDKLGDFMLAWPAMALLKRHLPDCEITVLVPAYTAPVARLCPSIDHILIDEGEGAFALAGKLRAQHFDAAITLFSTGRVGAALWLANIRYRLAPATKLAQFFYNHRLTQRRSRSEKPEYAYNIDLVLHYLNDHHHPVSAVTSVDNDWLTDDLGRPFLDLPTERADFCHQMGINPESMLVFIHPGSGGSANNLRPDQYISLANQLKSEQPLTFIVTSGPGEEAIAKEVVVGIKYPSHHYQAKGGLDEFCQTLALADLFISGSTGPLHIAGALNRPTAAFYPRHRSATPLRWQTLNAPEMRLAFTPPEGSEAADVQQIDIASAAYEISCHFLH